MDAAKCLEILQERQRQPSNFEIIKSTGANETLRINIQFLSVEKADELSILELFVLFINLQTERVQTYRLFEEELNSLLSTSSLECYPSLCSSVTAKFSSISQSIMSIRTSLINRSCNEAVAHINTIQGKEKEKLALIAAHHLDIMHDSLGMEKITGGKTSQQQDYLKEKITSIEQQISEALEEIQILKCDLIE